jgi:hypothetical protein
MRACVTGLVLLAGTGAPAGADRTPARLPASAERLAIVVFQDVWILQGRMGERYEASLPSKGAVHWYTFEMPADGVIYLQNFATEQNFSTLDLLDAKGYDPDPASWMENIGSRRAFNGRVQKGRYFIRIACPKGCAEPVVTELARFEE